MLLGCHKSLRALFMYLSELILSVIFFVGEQLLVPFGVRLIPSLLENKLSVFLQGDRNCILSCSLNFFNTLLFSLEYLFSLQYLTTRVLDEEVLDGVI